jgi:hypothetical protein
MSRRQRLAAREFSRVHPIQETGKRPTAGLDRNLAYITLVELLYGYPLDGGGDGQLARDRSVGRADAQRLAQGRAYGFAGDDVLIVETRAALAFYLDRRWGLDLPSSRLEHVPDE